MVVDIIAAFLDGSTGMVNIALEYMDGGSLQDLVNSGGCSDEAVLTDITYQMLRGLEYLHSHGRMHR